LMGLVSSPASMGTTVRQAFFQVTSILTTTGFGTAPIICSGPRWLMLFLLFFMSVGGCAGSTGGGIKVMRLLILLKHAKLELKKMLHPRGVYTLWLNNRPCRRACRPMCWASSCCS
jgi:trk system potassium uptake protein TrkH